MSLLWPVLGSWKIPFFDRNTISLKLTEDLCLGVTAGRTATMAPMSLTVLVGDYCLHTTVVKNWGGNRTLGFGNFQ